MNRRSFFQSTAGTAAAVSSPDPCPRAFAASTMAAKGRPGEEIATDEDFGLPSAMNSPLTVPSSISTTATSVPALRTRPGSHAVISTTAWARNTMIQQLANISRPQCMIAKTPWRGSGRDRHLPAIPASLSKSRSLEHRSNPATRCSPITQDYPRHVNPPLPPRPRRHQGQDRSFKVPVQNQDDSYHLLSKPSRRRPS